MYMYIYIYIYIYNNDDYFLLSRHSIETDDSVSGSLRCLNKAIIFH